MLKTFKKYIRLNPNIFNKSNDLNYGDVYLEKQNEFNDFIIADYGKSYDFHDTNFGVHGVLEWTKRIYESLVAGSNGNTSSQTSSNKSDMIIYPELSINVTKSDCNIFQYLEHIKDFVKKKESCMELFYTKIIHDEDYNSELCDHVITIYKGEPLPLKTKEELFMDSFFHKEKQNLWDYFKKLQYEPSFFHKCGQNPRMNILLYGPPGSGKSSFIYRIARCLDRHIISVDLCTVFKKSKAYQIIQKPHINSMNQKCIVVLEEFDIAVKTLYKQECENNNNNNKKDIVTAKKTHDFTLRDLLDIFQGTVPVDGSIIFATTNKYEEIKELCPALFRAGRLTPIYFGYLGKDEISAMCEYYFGKPLILDIEGDITIHTSALVETALGIQIRYPNKDEAFDAFKRYIEINMD